MDPLRLDDEAVFHVARRIEAPEARAAYLDQVCADNPDLRAAVEVLLSAYDRERSFLESPAVDSHRSATAASPAPIEGPGTAIGPYKLLEQIGEGGMGVVYAAEQAQPVRRRVALKIIKPGMDTRQVIARFEAERQALALMDHPNIARVLDAGATDSGRPYFVMELVKGVAITAYCDAVRLPARERLELFVPVCQAIQHAHQKGIIHRDVKPSNVLITMVDGKPVPKVIDFGVAKAIDQRLTERTIFTQHGAVVGTFEYMSPEQAELSGLDIDTRADVYALGVLLYELLTGTTPLQKEQVHQAAYSEVLRRIREEEPPKPSTRLSGLRRAPGVAGGTAADRAGAAHEAGAGRARLGCDEGARQGPHAPLRDGQRVRPRHPALPSRRAGRGRAANGGVQAPQVRPQAPNSAVRGHRVRGPAARCRDGRHLPRRARHGRRAAGEPAAV
jgi:serine/threonine-protein kinase